LPPVAVIATTMPAITTPAATIGQRRLRDGDTVLAPAAPVIVDAVGCGGRPGSSAVGNAWDPTMPRVRCTEIAAWASDCAYFASACASSAVFWNRAAGSFSRQRYTMFSRSPG